MRGRTNVTQRTAPYVNGNVIDALVESGTVNIGDFVEYKTVTGSEVISNVGGVICQEEQDDSFKYILMVRNSTIMLCTYNLETLTQLDCYSVDVDDAHYPKFCLIGDSNIVLCFQNGSSTLEMRYISVSNSGILSVVYSGSRSLTFNSNNYSPTTVCEYGSDNFLVFCSYYTSQNVSYDVKVIQFSVTGSISYVKTITLSTTNRGTPNNSNWDSLAFSDGSNIYYICPQYGSPNVTYKSYKLTLTGEVSCVNLGNVFASTTDNFNRGVKNVKIIKLNENAFVMCCNESNTEWNLYLLKYDDINESVSIVDSKNIVVGSYVYYVSISFIEENKFVLLSSSNYTNLNTATIYLFDNTTNLLSNSNVVLTESLGTSNQYNIFANIYNGNVKIIKLGYEVYRSLKLSYLNGVLSGFLDTNYVKKYVGGNAIGFAKSSGSTNQSIKVYIPTIN